MVNVPDKKQVAKLEELEKRIKYEENKIEGYKRSVISEICRVAPRCRKGTSIRKI